MKNCEVVETKRMAHIRTARREASIWWFPRFLWPTGHVVTPVANNKHYSICIYQSLPLWSLALHLYILSDKTIYLSLSWVVKSTRHIFVKTKIFSFSFMITSWNMCVCCTASLHLKAFLMSVTVSKPPQSPIQLFLPSLQICIILTNQKFSNTISNQCYRWLQRLTQNTQRVH